MKHTFLSAALCAGLSIIALCMAGCSKQERAVGGTLLGGGLGATVGGLAGGGTGAAIGGTVGALLGGITGSATGDESSSRY